MTQCSFFRSLFWLLLSACLFSCSNLHLYRDKLPCYTGINPGLDTLINIQGFYRQRHIRDMHGIYQYNKNGKLVEIGMDTSYNYSMFFEDGMFIQGFDYYHERADSMAAYFNRQASFSQSVSSSAHIHGTYTLHGDTIKVRIIRQGGTVLWGGWEKWFRIIDRNTIVDFYSALLSVAWEDRHKEDYQPKFYKAEPSRFVALDKKPQSLSWLKEEEWFTCTGKKAEKWRKRKER